MQYNSQIRHRKSIRLKDYDYSQAGLYFITLCTFNRECLFGNISHGQMELNDAGIIADRYWMEIPKHFPRVILHEYVIMPNHVHGIIELSPTVGVEYFQPPSINNPNISVENFPPPSPNVIPIVGVEYFQPPSKNNNPTENLVDNPQVENPEIKNPEIENTGIENTGIENKRVENIQPLLRDDEHIIRIENFQSSPERKNKFQKIIPGSIGSVIRGYKIGVTKWFRNDRLENYPPERQIWQRNYYEHIIRNSNSCQHISDYIVNNALNWKEDNFYIND